MHLEGFDLVSNSALQDWQELLDFVEIFEAEEREEEALRIAALVFLTKKFFTFACSLKRTRMKLFRNQRAALEESGMMELPWIWIVRVEWWRCTLTPPSNFCSDTKEKESSFVASRPVKSSVMVTLSTVMAMSPQESTERLLRVPNDALATCI